MKVRAAVATFMAMAVLAVGAGCGDSDSDGSGEAEANQQAGMSQPSSSTDLPQGDEPVNLDPGDFTANVDNPYWPLKPGTRWVYSETDTTGEELQVVVTVTNETKKIANGITARVVRDTVTEEGQLIEDTFDWYAQDSAGNVWYMGENTAEFEDGEIASREGSFEAGVDGAQAGIIMPADPEPGMAYRQEYYEGKAEDNGEVIALDQQVQTPAGRYKGALMTRDTNAIEPAVNEYKLYAPGVGMVLADGVSGGPPSFEELIGIDTAPAQFVEQAATAPLGKGPSFKP